MVDRQFSILQTLNPSDGARPGMSFDLFFCFFVAMCLSVRQKIFNSSTARICLGASNRKLILILSVVTPQDILSKVHDDPETMAALTNKLFKPVRVSYTRQQ